MTRSSVFKKIQRLTVLFRPRTYLLHRERRYTERFELRAQLPYLHAPDVVVVYATHGTMKERVQLQECLFSSATTICVSLAGAMELINPGIKTLEFAVL